MRHSHSPVAVIYDERPLTNSLASELATAIAFDEASRRGVELVAVHTWMNHADFYVEVAWDGVTAQAEEELAQRLAGWRERYPDVAVRRVVGQDKPASRLVEESAAAELFGRGQSWAWWIRRAVVGFRQFGRRAVGADPSDSGPAVLKVDDGFSC